jgi:hypothetical protein
VRGTMESASLEFFLSSLVSVQFTAVRLCYFILKKLSLVKADASVIRDGGVCLLAAAFETLVSGAARSKPLDVSFCLGSNRSRCCAECSKLLFLSPLMLTFVSSSLVCSLTHTPTKLGKF